MEDNYRVIKIKTNSQNLYGWIALTNDDHPIGHVFMQVELNDKIKFMDAWVHEDYRRQGIFTALWDARWKFAKKVFPGSIAFAWCLPTSVNLYKKKGFTEGDPAIYMEKIIEDENS